MVSVLLPVPPPVSCRVPESPAMVPVLLTKTEIRELPEPADFSRIPALVNDVPVAPLLFSRDASAWKLKVAPCSLLICVPVAQEIVPVPVSKIVSVLVSVPDRPKVDVPEIVSVPALVTFPATLPAFHCKMPPVKARVAPLAPVPVKTRPFEDKSTVPEPEPPNVPEKLPLRATVPGIVALMVSVPLPLPPPVSCRVPESPAMVPVLATGREIGSCPSLPISPGFRHW